MKWTLTVEQSHSYRSGAGKHFRYHRGVVDVPVLLIVYRRANERLVPFSVITPTDTWDVDYCRRDECCYYHASGSGVFLPRRVWAFGRLTTLPGRGRRRTYTTRRKGYGVEFYGQSATQVTAMGGEDAAIWFERGVQQFETAAGSLA